MYEVDLAVTDHGYRASLGQQNFDVQVFHSAPGEMRLMINGRFVIIYWAVDGPRRWISVNGKTFVLETPSSTGQRKHGDVSATENELRAPMPGQVRAVQVEQGAQVERGQTIMLLEAMKMELRIQAPHAGRVTRLLVQPGDAVERDQVLAEIA